MFNLKEIKQQISKDCSHLGWGKLILLIIVIGWGSFLRTYELNNLGILFSDAGRDLLVATESLDTKTVPLLGIPSSIPQFKQGPVSIWYTMSVITVFGHKYIFLALAFSILSIFALIALYELLANTLPKNNFLSMFLSLLLLATSPLAIANARVPYHTTPIPLVTVLFLWMTYRWWKQKKYGLFGAVLSWCLLFQFELAILPLFLVFPYIYWKKSKLPSYSEIKIASLATFLGLLPQISFDITHKFQQLGGFTAWTAYRISSFIIPNTSHSLKISGLKITINQFIKFGGRVFSTDNLLISVFILSILIYAAYTSWKKFKAEKLPFIIELSWIATIALTTAYFVHSSPSEAYFPPFFILLPILVGYGINNARKELKILLTTMVFLISLLNSSQIFKHNFFVSNTQSFSYGASVDEQRQIVSQIASKTDNNYYLKTTKEAGKFESYFNNYDWFSQTEFGITQNKDGKKVYIEDQNSSLMSYPNSKTILTKSKAIIFFE